MYEVLYFVSGALIANGIPHYMRGVVGEKFQTPFGRPSSAVVNVVWGTFNFVLGWALWHYAGMHRSHMHTFRYELAFGLGAFVMSLASAYAWSMMAPGKGKK
jgi:hypothetical protein